MKESQENKMNWVDQYLVSIKGITGLQADIIFPFKTDSQQMEDCWQVS